MKKGIKLGLALAVGGLAQEGIAQTQTQTEKNLRDVVGENKDWKGDTSKTYVATPADFKEKKLDSLDVTQAVSILNDTINKLMASYGKDELNKKIHEINEKYPDFEKLSEGKQKEIIMEKFVGSTNGFLEFVGGFVVIMFIIGLVGRLARATSGGR